MTLNAVTTNSTRFLEARVTVLDTSTNNTAGRGIAGLNSASIMTLTLNISGVGNRTLNFTSTGTTSSTLIPGMIIEVGAGNYICGCTSVAFTGTAIIVGANGTAEAYSTEIQIADSASMYFGVNAIQADVRKINGSDVQYTVSGGALYQKTDESDGVNLNPNQHVIADSGTITYISGNIGGNLIGTVGGGTVTLASGQHVIVDSGTVTMVSGNIAGHLLGGVGGTLNAPIAGVTIAAGQTIAAVTGSVGGSIGGSLLGSVNGSLGGNIGGHLFGGVGGTLNAPIAGVTLAANQHVIVDVDNSTMSAAILANAQSANTQTATLVTRIGTPNNLTLVGDIAAVLVTATQAYNQAASAAGYAENACGHAQTAATVITQACANTGTLLTNLATKPTAQQIDDKLSDEHGDGSWEGGGGGGGSAQGPGEDPVVVEIVVGGSKIADASVWITESPDIDDLVAGTLQTDSDGRVTFLLTYGLDYYLWAKKDGSINPILAQLFTAGPG